MITITAIHPQDAWYTCRDELIGLTGAHVGRITHTADNWYQLTFVYRGQEITFMYCQFQKG